MKNALHELQCFHRPPGAMARMVIQGHNEYLRSSTHKMHSSCCSPPFPGLITVKLQPSNNTLSTLSQFKEAVPEEEGRASWFRASQLEQSRHSHQGGCSACAEPSSARGGGTQPWQRVRESPNYIIIGMHPNVPKRSLCFLPAWCEITRKQTCLAKWREHNLAGRCDCWHDPLGKQISSALGDIFISVMLCTKVWLSFKLARANQPSKRELHDAAHPVRLSSHRKHSGRDLAAVCRSAEAVHRPGLLSNCCAVHHNTDKKSLSGKR